MSDSNSRRPLIERCLEELRDRIDPRTSSRQNGKTYRSLARPKQLPPDSEGFFELLCNTVDPETGKRNSELVSVVTHFTDRGKPIETKLSDMSPEEWGEWSSFFIWFIVCGRGFGKSWTGGSWINEGARNATGEYMAIMGRDAHDVRAYCIEGESGLLRTSPNDFYPKYEPSKRLVTWPNGVKAQLFYAEEPDTVRGPNNFRAWCDEPASYQDAALGLNGPNGEDTAMSNLLMTLRKGDPQLLITGTPKPHKLIKDLLAYEGAVIVRGGTRENRANLAPRWLKEMEQRYAGTRLGRQELDGEVLDDNPGALVRRAWIEKNRVNKAPPDMERIVVGVDPQIGEHGEVISGENAKTGIIPVGRWWHPGEERYHFYVLADKTTSGSPAAWAKEAVTTYRWFSADRIIVERNNGGAMCEHTIRTVDANVPVSTVWASRGKHTRAEPVAGLYEQDRVHHVGHPRDFEELEDQLCTWQPGMKSPDNMDAEVWAITDLDDQGIVDTDDDSYDDFWGRQ